MRIEDEVVKKMLAPLENNAVPTIEEYLTEIDESVIQVSNPDGQVNPEFKVYFDYLISKRMICSSDGKYDPKSMGIHWAVGGLSIVGDRRIMKSEIGGGIMGQTININNASQVQVGDGNSQEMTITMKELADKIAKSGDQEAKSALKALLENSTVASMLGVAATTLISHL